MAELVKNIDSNVVNLYSKLEESENRLKSLDANITKLTGRDPSERRLSSDNNRKNNNSREGYNRSNADPYEKRPVTAGFANRRDSRNGRGDRGEGFNREPARDAQSVRQSRRSSGSRDGRLAGSDVREPRGGREARSSREFRDRRGSNRDNFHGDPNNRNNDIVTPTKQKGMVASSIIVKPDEIISRSEEITNEAKATPTDLKKRNKRMFGMLMGTLNQFKTRENQEENKSVEKRKQVEKRIEEKAFEEKRTQQMEKMQLFNMRKQEKKNIFETKFKMEVAQMHSDWDKSKRALLPFIKTKVKPSLFFKPSNMDNKKITEAYELSCRRIEDEIKERRFAFDSSLQHQFEAEKKETEPVPENRKRKAGEDFKAAEQEDNVCETIKKVKDDNNRTSDHNQGDLNHSQSNGSSSDSDDAKSDTSSNK